MFHAVAGPTKPGRAWARSFSRETKSWLELQVPGRQAQLEIFPWGPTPRNREKNGIRGLSAGKRKSSRNRIRLEINYSLIFFPGGFFL
jgi:hypothetical protein